MSVWRRLTDSRAWRIPATGLGFALFGGGGLVLSVSVFPLLYLTPMPAARRQYLTRALVSRLFRFYVRVLRALGLFDYDVQGEQVLRQPNQLIVANHPTLLDVVFLIGLSGPANCVIKASLWRNPFTALTMRAANYIRNDGDDLFERCVHALQNGDTLIIFPEGTRTRPGEPLKFQRGPANIALSAGMDFTPVLITCEPVMLIKHRRWYQVTRRPSHFRFRVLPRFSTAGYLTDPSAQGRAARRLTRDLKALFERELDRAQTPIPR